MSIIHLRKKRNRLKKEYFVLTGVGSFCLLLAITLLIGKVGPIEFIDYLELYQTAQSIRSDSTREIEVKSYTQTGTGVAFNQFEIDYTFKVKNQFYSGRGTVNYPTFSSSIILYYSKNDPSNHSLLKPNLSRIFVLLILGTIPWLIAILCLSAGYLCFMRWRTLQQQITISGT